MEKIKIAEFFGEPLNYGGQEAFITNAYSNMCEEALDFTFITPFECKNTQLSEMIRNNKDSLIVDNQLFESKLRKKFIINTAKKYLNNKYDIIHIHSGSIFTLYKVAKIAKKRGIKKVIVHSHATGKVNLKYRVIKFISDRSIFKYADYYLACSDEAAKWKFPSKIINNRKYVVINNGIDINKFTFNQANRGEIRKKYSISDDTKVLINVGRLSEEKNQGFLLKIVKELKQKNDKICLFLVGDGILKAKLEEEIEKMDIKNNVKMVGNTNDVDKYLCAADCFLFPSYYEGLGISAIEAQVNGLTTICSNKVPRHTKISKKCYFLDINLKEWMELIEKCQINNNRSYEGSDIQKYDIRFTSKELLKIYTDKTNNYKH